MNPNTIRSLVTQPLPVPPTQRAILRAETAGEEQGA